MDRTSLVLGSTIAIGIVFLCVSYLLEKDNPIENIDNHIDSSSSFATMATFYERKITPIYDAIEKGNIYISYLSVYLFNHSV